MYAALETVLADAYMAEAMIEEDKAQPLFNVEVYTGIDWESTELMRGRVLWQARVMRRAFQKLKYEVRLVPVNL